MCKNPGKSTPSIYEIRIAGRLSPELVAWLGNTTQAVMTESSSPAATILNVPVFDQSALFGILTRIRDLGLKLISVNRIDQGMDLLPERNR